MALEITEKMGRTTHFWVEINGEICIRDTSYGNIHAIVFDDLVEDRNKQIWNNEFRGYFDEKNGVISCHAKINKKYLKRLERAFDKEELIAIYFHGSVDENSPQILCKMLKDHGFDAEFDYWDRHIIVTFEDHNVVIDKEKLTVQYIRKFIIENK